MNKKSVLICILVVVLVVIGYLVFIAANFGNQKIKPVASCIKAGEVYQSPAVLGEKKGECCEGLNVIAEYSVAPSEVNCELFQTMGGGNSICSACGNGNCEATWENKCNCPQDCGQQLNVFITPKNITELHSCVSKSDCEFVEPKTCCGCYEVINKKYVKYWGSLSKQDCNSLDIACQMCQYYPDDLNIVCKDNMCQAEPIKK